MSLLKALGLVRRAAAAVEPEQEPEVVEQRAEQGRAVFQEAALILEDYYRLRVIITNIGPRGVSVAYFEKTDLPFRVRLAAPNLKLKCWARVVSQGDGAAEL